MSSARLNSLKAGSVIHCPKKIGHAPIMGSGSHGARASRMVLPTKLAGCVNAQLKPMRSIHNNCPSASESAMRPQVSWYSECFDDSCTHAIMVNIYPSQPMALACGCTDDHAVTDGAWCLAVIMSFLKHNMLLLDGACRSQDWCIEQAPGALTQLKSGE